MEGESGVGVDETTRFGGGVVLSELLFAGTIGAVVGCKEEIVELGRL